MIGRGSTIGSTSSTDDEQAYIESQERRRRVDDLLQRGAGWYQTLHQTTRWRGEDGTVWALVEMDDSHRRNLIRWLDDRSESIVSIAYWGPCALFPGDEFGGLPIGVDEALEVEADLMLDDPRGWLRDTPLYRRLRELSPIPSAPPAPPLPHELEV